MTDQPETEAPLSPIPVTSRPVRARIDGIKAETNHEFQERLGRNATWNEVLARMCDAYDMLGRAELLKAAWERRADR